MSPFIKDIINLFRSRVLMLVCTLVVTILVARTIGPAGNGYIASLTVYPEVCTNILAIGMMQAIVFYVGKKIYDDQTIYVSIIAIWLISVVFCITICYLLIRLTIKGDYPVNLIFLALVPLAFSLFNIYNSAYFLGKNNIKVFSKINWIPNFLRMLGVILFVVVLSVGVKGVLYSTLLGVAVMAVFVYRSITKYVKFKIEFNFAIIWPILKLGVFYAVSLLVIQLNYKVDIILLQHYSTNSQLGIYTKGVSLVEFLWEIPAFMGSAIFSRSSSAPDADEFSRKVCSLLRVCIIVVLFASVVFFILSKFIMVTLYGAAYLGSSMVQRILLPGVLILTIFKVLNMDLQGRGKPWIAMKAMSVSLIVNMVLNCILDTKYGANGAAFASTVSYSISAVLFLYFYSLEVKIPLLQILTFTKTDFVFLDAILIKFKSKFKNGTAN